MTIEHEIATWAKLDGTWEVTHKRMYTENSQYLYDISRDFKDGFKTRSEAEEYAIKLFNKWAKEGHRIELHSPNSWGQESTTVGFGGGNCWESFKGYSWFWVYKNGKITKRGEPKYENS